MDMTTARVLVLSVIASSCVSLTAFGQTASVTATDESAYEDGGDPAAFTITLSESAVSNLTVNYDVYGTAEPGADYTPLSGSAVISLGTSNVIVNVSPVSSATVEASETVTIALANGAGYSTGAQASATVRIYDYSAPSGIFYYVKTDGSDANTGLSIAQAFQTIQKGADVATAGDTVYVLDGTYYNSGYTTNHNNGTTALSNPNLLTIPASGTAGNYIHFRAYPDGNATKPKLMYDGAGGIKINNNVSYIVIDGFEIQGPAKTITYSQAVTNRWTKPNYYTGRGIYSWGPGSHIYISNCDSHHSCGSGIRFNKGDYVVFENNVIANNTWWSSSAESGVVLAESTSIDTNDIVKMLYARNTLYNNWNRLPFCNPSAQGTTNYGDGFNYQGGKIIDGQGLYVTRNNATYAYGRMRMENNVAYNNGFNGMVYHKTDRGELINNTIYMNGAWPGDANYSCLTINTATNVKAYNNILWARSASHYALKDNGGNSGIDVRNNNIPVGMTQFANVDGTNADPQFVYAPDLTSYTPTNYAPDAIDDAVRALGIDFHLQASSPVIDTGTALLAASGDKDMDARPQGAGIDMGCDEWVGEQLLVSAGNDIVLVHPTLATSVSGVITDPSAGSPTSAWTQVSGPGTVTFGDASATNTTVTLPSVIGTYGLRFYADNGITDDYDDMTITLEPSASNLISNTGFETGTTAGWTQHASLTLAVVSNEAHEGVYSCLNSGRDAAFDGVAVELKDTLSTGTTYVISAWVKLENVPSATVNLKIKKVEIGVSTQHITVASVAATNTAWRKLSGEFTLASSGTLGTLLLYMSGPGAGINYWADNYLCYKGSLATPDADGDSIPDEWELQHFGNTASTSGQLGEDADGDSFIDLHEYYALTDPNDPTEVFVIDVMDLVATNSEQSVVTWYGAADRLYSVLSATNLLGGWTTNAYQLPGNDTTMAQTNSSPSPSVFYRLRVELP